LDALPTSDEQDSRQLNQLRGEIVQTSSALDSLVNALSAEVAQNNAFIAKERASIVALAQGQAPQVSARPPTQPNTPAPAGLTPQAPITAQTAMQRSAFVTIKFDRPNVAYREALATALTQALKRRPEASFDIVGVSATATADAEELVRARAEDVSRTMMELGVPAAKLAIDATSLKSLIADEVRIFVH
jgi:outer membrane protein OmpA-like peptidoglycan-associated protein